MKKILITGGCGFIGHNLALHLSQLNYEVFALHEDLATALSLKLGC